MEKTNLNVLITGASGLLGRTVLDYFTQKELREKYPLNGTKKNQGEPNLFDSNKVTLNTLGLCFSRARKNLRSIDLSDKSQVDKLIDDFKVWNESKYVF